MFNGLNEVDKNKVVGAMDIKTFEPNEFVIR